MASYHTRIFIKVFSPDVWEKLYSMDLSRHGFLTDAEDEFDLEETEYTMDDIVSMDESELKAFAKDLKNYLGEDGVFIMDTTDLSVDPSNFCVYYLGGSVRTATVSGDMHEETSIQDIRDWLDVGELKLTGEEEEFLLEVDI